MTEQEWLGSSDPEAMIRLATGRVSLCCGCFWCDNGDDTESLAAGQKCCQLCDNATPAAGYRRITSDRKLRLWIAAMMGFSTGRMYDNSDINSRWSNGEQVSDEQVRVGFLRTQAIAWTDRNLDNEGDPPLPIRAALLRDIVGNPFLSVMRVGVDWGDFIHHDKHLLVYDRRITRDVLSLARAAYDGRSADSTLDAARLAVLSDAMEEAGCPSRPCPTCLGRGVTPQEHPWGDTWATEWLGCPHCEGLGILPHDLVSHLRSGEPHVRGCHVIDLILGKE